MSIGVIRKWKPEDIDPGKYPGVHNLASSFAGRIDPSKLRSTGSSGTTGCSSCDDTGKDELGRPCKECWQPLSNRAVDTMAEGDIEDRSNSLLWLAEPMDLSFRFLRGQGQQIRGAKINEALANLAEDSGILDDAGADPEDQVGLEPEEEEEHVETPDERLARLISQDPELKERKSKQPSHALVGGYSGYQAGPNHPNRQLYQRGNLGLED